MIGISVCLFTFRMRGCKSGGRFVPTTHYKLIESQVRERGFMFMKSSICSNFSLSCRDVDFPRHDVNLTPPCHVATCIFMSRRQFNTPLSRRDVNLYTPLSRRDVSFHVATWICTSLCHVATSSSTSQRHFKSTLCHVATLPNEALCHVAT